LTGIARPIITIFEDETYSKIFKKISTQHQHIAVVKDSNNNLKGLLTLEDLIEEIVGEIEDEYDILKTHFYPITPTRFIAGGGVKITKINQECDLNLPDEELTMNEWIIKNFGIDNRSGNKYDGFNARFILKKISRGRISELIIEKS
jgi:CBS domain containing-hemolysin-like protein